MAITCVDWRQGDTGVLASLYAAEISRWSATLCWDTDASWDHIELGRQLGTLPGLLAFDAHGTIVGWTFYLLHRGVLQIGGFVTDSELTTTALVDGIFTSEAAASAESFTVFVFTDAPGLTTGLARRGLTVGAYDYLMKPLVHHPITPSPHHSVTPSPHHPITPSLHHSIQQGVSLDLRRWRASDGEAVATLLEAAYPGADGVRPFAPRGTSEEWREYVGQLVGAAGCGTIMPESCYVAPRGPDRVSGVVLVTRLAAATAHIAQLAVDPQAHRRGLGRLLVNAACASATDAGCDGMTLLVEGRNDAARRLYEASGFQAVARFVSAGSRQPLRLTRIAAGRSAVIRA